MAHFVIKATLFSCLFEIENILVYICRDLISLVQKYVCVFWICPASINVFQKNAHKNFNHLLDYISENAVFDALGKKLLTFK
jgi:hypothetical protein